MRRGVWESAGGGGAVLDPREGDLLQGGGYGAHYNAGVSRKI